MGDVDERRSYRINTDDEQVRLEHERLLTLARVVDPPTRAALEPLVQPGWRCCDVGSGAGTVAEWLADRVGADGAVVSLDVDTRFQPPSAGNVEVRQTDVTTEPIGDAEYDLVHARGVLQHLHQREEVLAAMVRAAKPGGWVVVTDTDWVQYDQQDIPEPFATLSSTLRAHSVQQHGHDAQWGRRLIPAFQAAGLVDVDASGRCWTMHGGTDSAEWYVGALARALPVLPPEVFPEGHDPEAAIAKAREPDFAILSPLSITCIGRRP
jgi:2-polyprenyl-3-methyl-5-hydroxy-6-metoxy-1,4-benzoquinol methylase